MILTILRSATVLALLMGLVGCEPEIHASDNCKGLSAENRCCSINTGGGNFDSFCSTESACQSRAGDRSYRWPADNDISNATFGCRSK